MEKIEVADSSAKPIVYHHITDSDPPPNRWFKRFLNAGDSLMSIFVITPLVVTHWRGTWVFMDHHAEYFPPWNCFILGLVVHLTFTLLRELLIENFATNKKNKKSAKEKVIGFIVSRIYCYLFSISCNMQWRGGWGVMELYLGPDYKPALWVSFGCLIGLTVFVSVRNLIAPPYILVTDRRDMSFMFPTRYRVELYKMRGSTAGLAESIILPSSTSHAILLEIIDTALSAFIIGPFVVGYWRGTWNIMAFLLYPDNLKSSSYASLAIGVMGHLIFTIFQNHFSRIFNPNQHRLTYYIGSRIYTYLFSAVCINGWRGLWQLIDLNTEHDIYSVLIITASSVIILAAFRGLRNISASPFFLAQDKPEDYFLIPTMFKTSGSREPVLYILDCLFSVIFIGSLVVFVWRGAWVLLDLTLFTEDKGLSALGSLVIGYGVVGITFALQPIMRWACDRLGGIWRIAVADIFLFISFIGTINVWRGVWQLLDVYFIPENKLLSDLITHFVSIILLALLNCSNSVLVRGVYIDAEEPAGQCVIFPVYYIRLFFQKERTKKQKRLFIEALDNQQEQHNSLLMEKRTANHVVITHHIKSEKNQTGSN